MAITFNHNTSVISLTAPETNLLLMQDLIDAIRVEEQSELGIQYPSIAEATGKTDIGGGVVSDITITLTDNWQIAHAPGNYQAVLKGGQVVGGLGANPIKYVPGVQIKLIQSVAGTIVATGSGLSNEQDARLSNIDSLLSDIENSLDHRQAMRVLLATMAGKVSGAQSNLISFRDMADLKDRILATVDGNGNRTGIVLDVS